VIQNLLRIFSESFSPLSIRNFRIYLSGQAVSLIGTWLQMTAQAWVVWEISQSKTALGVVAMLGSLPILLLGPFAGVWADRLDRRKLLIVSQAGMMVLAFILAALVQTNLVQLWHVYVLATLLGILTAIDMPAQQAFLGDLSGVQHVRKAVNLNAMIIQVSRMVGPAAAGFIIGQLGVSTAFWMNGVSFIAVIVSLIAVKASQMQMRGGQKGGFMDGLRYLRTQPRLLDLIFFVVLLTFFGLPIIQMLPAFASEVLHGDAQTLGLLMGASGAGALISTLFFVPVTQNFKRPGVIVSIAVLWMGAWFGAFSAFTWEPLALTAMFMGSLGAPIVFTMALGLMQVLAPAEMRARLLSVFTMVSFGMQPVASLLIGISADTLGTETAIRINGMMMIVGAVSMILLRPQLRVWQIMPGAAPQTTGKSERETELEVMDAPAIAGAD
jgi:MFS family permease